MGEQNPSSREKSSQIPPLTHPDHQNIPETPPQQPVKSANGNGNGNGNGKQATSRVEIVESSPKPEHAPREDWNGVTRESVGFLPGAIVMWDEKFVGLYIRPERSKGYDLVYIMTDNGRLSPKGIVLHAYGVQVLGQVPMALYEQMEKTLILNRDAIVANLFDPQDGKWIPYVQRTATPTPAPAPTPPPSMQGAQRTPSPSRPMLHQLKRGARISIKIGDKSWDAVYWGRDVQNYIVAHDSHGQWALMHLNLSRFKDSIETKGMLTSDELENIARHLLRAGQTRH